ncbi:MULTISPECIES: murein biosynthesis integral membrane protein MurJ [Prochlorococcus]|uniref:murein biosynthesis integral membrane protein MurJ n=1 Tax=Prochlorococcus TaxID=1218 RepID=UPI000533A6BE|nr:MULTISPECIES: murein biosynthesis integral membrane protein MurJ [Prochlorococcus]KGG13102.1 Virulence factor mviN [Prochlorococcus sp. MIT 0601]
MKRSLKKIALIVSFGTLLSKVGGMTRQLVIAGAFGVGAAYDAYNYAYVIPGFFLILIGGINGPLHNAMVTVLSRRNKLENAYIISSINTSISLFLIVVSAILFFIPDEIIRIVGPGLSIEVHDIAAKQLQIMSPIAFLSGLIGIGFGSLNANSQFFIPSISPIISSLSLIIAAGAFWIYQNPTNSPSEINLKGGIILAQATLIGAFLQLIIQIPALVKKGLFKFKLIWDWTHPGVKEVWGIATPAILSSGMLQVNVITDLFFASSILGAAAGLGYANFLIQAPLGLFSNAILIPLLPTFAKLAKENDKHLLITKIKQGLILCSASMILLGSIFVVLGTSIIDLIYGRGAFDSEAISLVGGLLVAYGFGMPAYLCRDLLVRVFYSLGDGSTPFRLSSIGIILNVILDWALIGGPSPWGNQLGINFGAKGLVLATVGVNIFTCIGLLFKLNKSIQGIPLKEWLNEVFKLIICGLISGFTALLSSYIYLMPIGFFSGIIRLIFISMVSILTFVLMANYFKIKDINYIFKNFLERINLL